MDGEERHIFIKVKKEILNEEKEEKKLSQTQIFNFANNVNGINDINDKKNTTIVPVKVKNTLIKLAGRSALIPEPHFLMCIVAPVRSGKSVLLCNLAFRESYYRDVFSRIVTISSSVELDETLAPFRQFEYYSPSSGKELDEYIQIASNDPTQSTLLIIDDCADLIKPGDKLCKLATKYRHLNMSIIITSQYFMLLPPVIRTNMTVCILFKLANAEELEKIFKAFGHSFGAKLEIAYTEVFGGDRKYNFLALNFRNGVITDNFDKIL